MKEFKVNERVAVYIGVHRCTAEVRSILEFGHLQIKCDPKQAYLFTVVHPKQCRRLKKKVRREWWLAFDSNGFPLMTSPKQIFKKHTVDDIVHVREVRNAKAK